MLLVSKAYLQRYSGINTAIALWRQNKDANRANKTEERFGLNGKSHGEKREFWLERAIVFTLKNKIK